jgi:hypothetical protein
MGIPPSQIELNKIREDAKHLIAQGTLTGNKKAKEIGLNKLAWVQEWDLSEGKGGRKTTA